MTVDIVCEARVEREERGTQTSEVRSESEAGPSRGGEWLVASYGLLVKGED